MSINIDGDTTPDTYIEHRELVRIGEAGTTSRPQPTRIRVGSSTGASKEGAVEAWLAGGLPPMSAISATSRRATWTRLRSRRGSRRWPTSSRTSAELVTLPNRTNGYQRRAQATMAGDDGLGSTPARADQAGAIVLTSRAWGHEGGNDITAEFRNPGAPNAPLTVSVTGNDLVVSLGTDAAGTPTSTGDQVVDAINAYPAREPARGGRRVHPRKQREPADRPGQRHRAAAREGQPVRLPHHGDERPRPARPVRVLR